MTSATNNTATVQELGNLPIGTIIQYTDIANPNTKFVVLDEMKDKRFGDFTNVMNLKSQTIEPNQSNTKMTGKWSIYQEVITD